MHKILCDVCGKMHRSRSTLQSHMSMKHTKSAKYNCQECEFTFNDKQKYNYMIHKAYWYIPCNM